MRLALLPLFLLSVVCLPAAAQQFGGNPPSIHWQQINTDTVRVIFPMGLRQQAADVASITHALAQQTQHTIGDRLRKINIVLQNQTVISNAYVAPGPYRSEFFITPPQNSFELGSLPWQKMLALHEYRHVQQYNNFRKGLSKLFYILFGEEGQSVANSAAIPNWFWEGDAVYQETMQSHQGRGRLPWFFNDYRSLWLAGKNYSWMKLRNGSLRDFTPDHYRLGYMMVAYGREKFGEDFWRKVTDEAVRFDGLFYPFQRSLARYSGISYDRFRNDAVEYFLHDYHPSKNVDPAHEEAWEQKHFVASEEFPQWLDDHTLVFVKSSYKKLPAFVTRDVNTGQEKNIRVKDISTDNYFSCRNGRLVYAAYTTDPRWGWRDFQDLRVLDLATGRQRTLTHHTKYFSPDISPDGSQVVAVQETPGGSNFLHILDAASGNLVKAIPNPDSLVFTYPKFYGNDHIVAAVRDRQGGMALASVRIADGQTRTLIPFSMHVIGFPQVQHDTITFTAAYREHDELFMLAGEELYRLPVREATTGHYQLAVKGSRYAWTVFTATGSHIMLGDSTSRPRVRFAADSLATGLPDFHVSSLEANPNPVISTYGHQRYDATYYPQSFRLLNFHSWRPYISDPDYTFSVTSENVLNTLQSEFYFSYNRNERYKQLGWNAIYGGLFPWIKLGASYIIDRNGAYKGNQVYWNEWEERAGLQLPLHFTEGRHFTNFSVGTDIVYNKRIFRGLYKDSLDGRGFAYMDPSLSFANKTQKARQQIYPRWAQSLYVNYPVAVSKYTAHQLLASGYLYLPGLFLNHSLVISGAFQQRDTLRKVAFTNHFPFSRGYTAQNFHQMWKLGGNYHFPLLYPDWGFAQIVYFLRIRANLFYDHTRVEDPLLKPLGGQLDFRSWGTEIFFDTKWWNQHPISFGIRYSRLMDGGYQGLAPNQWEFILPINLLER